MNINIDRLTYCCASIEITRRCNLKCAHCLRGDAQDVDMTHDVIDAFLTHTQAIYTLSFTGGEPTLNIEGMRYFLESAKKHNVLIAGLSIISNGTVNNQSLIDLLRDYYNYISQFVSDKFHNESLITIFISNDTFHHTDIESTYQWYNDNLSQFAKINYCFNGNSVQKKGKAKRLEYSVDISHSVHHKVLVKTKDNNPLCTETNHFPLFHDNQVEVLCGVSVTADGYITDICDYAWNEFNPTNDAISSVFVESAQELVDNIEKWNKGKPYCYQQDSAYNSESMSLDYIYSAIKNNAPSQDVKDRFLFSMLESIYKNGMSYKELSAAYAVGWYIGANVVSVSLNFLSYCRDAEKNTSNLFDEVVSRRLSDRQTKEVITAANEQYKKELICRDEELFPDHWEHMKLFKYRDESQKHKHCRILSGVKFAKDMLKIKPDDEYYKRMLAQREQELFEFEVKIACNR